MGAMDMEHGGYPAGGGPRPGFTLLGEYPGVGPRPGFTLGGYSRERLAGYYLPGVPSVSLPDGPPLLGLDYVNSSHLLVEYSSHLHRFLPIFRTFLGDVLLPCCYSTDYMFFFQMMSSGGIR